MLASSEYPAADIDRVHLRIIQRLRRGNVLGGSSFFGRPRYRLRIGGTPRLAPVVRREGHDHAAGVRRGPATGRPLPPPLELWASEGLLLPGEESGQPRNDLEPTRSGYDQCVDHDTPFAIGADEYRVEV